VKALEEPIDSRIIPCELILLCRQRNLKLSILLLIK